MKRLHCIQNSYIDFVEHIVRTRSVLDRLFGLYRLSELSLHPSPLSFSSPPSLECNKKEHLKLPDKLGMNTESDTLERHRHDNSAGWLWDAVSRSTTLGCCEEITKLLSHSRITQTSVWFNQSNKNIAGLAQRQHDSWYKLIDQRKAWPVFHLKWNSGWHWELFWILFSCQCFH